MIALTRLDVAPAIVLLCSCAVGGGSFFMRRDVPPGVDTWISLRGVEGAKNGDLSIALLGAIVIIMLLLLFALNFRLACYRLKDATQMCFIFDMIHNHNSTEEILYYYGEETRAVFCQHKQPKPWTSRGTMGEYEMEGVVEE